MSAEELPQAIGDYRVVERLAEGAYGQLYLAESEAGAKVAVKRLKIDTLLDEKSLELFEREMRVLQSLSHRSIPSFIDSGVDADGLPYFVQRHVAGDNLETAVRGGTRFDNEGAKRLARDLLHALDYLHGLHPPVIHRDIKPANIVLSKQGPVLVDFGAVSVVVTAQGSGGGTVVGTFGYMAPEVLKGQASPASDLYSLGATLLFAFSGREPEDFPQERLEIRFRDEVTLPPRLADLIEALLQPAVEDRPSSAKEALALLGKRGKRVKKALDSQKSDALVKAASGDKPLLKSKRLRRIAIVSGLALTTIAVYQLGGPEVQALMHSVGIGVGVFILIILLFLTFVGGF